MIHYETRVDEIQLGKWGSMRFKQWLHNAPLSFNENSVNHVARFVKPGSFAVDVGGYTGDTALPMALATGPTGKVLVFEPGPTSYPLLLENIALNNFTWIESCNLAVIAKPGPVLFHYVDSGFINGGFSDALKAGREGCGNSFPHFVCGVNLDAFLRETSFAWLPKLSYVKIDTEGYDKDIVRSSAALFREFRPALEVEVYPFLDESERNELMDSIRGIGYRWEGPDANFFLPPPAVINIVCLPR